MAGSALAARGGKSARNRRVIGANDRINVGVIGVGGRGSYVGREFEKFGKDNNACQIVAVCDVYEKRKRAGGRALQSATATWIIARCWRVRTSTP